VPDGETVSASKNQNDVENSARSEEVWVFIAGGRLVRRLIIHLLSAYGLNVGDIRPLFAPSSCSNWLASFLMRWSRSCEGFLRPDKTPDRCRRHTPKYLAIGASWIPWAWKTAFDGWGAIRICPLTAIIPFPSDCLRKRSGRPTESQRMTFYEIVKV